MHHLQCMWAAGPYSCDVLVVWEGSASHHQFVGVTALDSHHQRHPSSPTGSFPKSLPECSHQSVCVCVCSCGCIWKQDVQVTDIRLNRDGPTSTLNLDSSKINISFQEVSCYHFGPFCAKSLFHVDRLQESALAGVGAIHSTDWPHLKYGGVYARGYLCSPVGFAARGWQLLGTQW